MKTPKRTAEANVLRDLERQLDELRAEVRSARADTAATVAQMDRMARTIRVSRRALVDSELQAGWDRLRPDLSLIRWKPRAGQQDYPEIGSGLIDRLKSGDPIADSVGNINPFIGAANSIIDPTLETFGQATFPTTGKSMGPWRASYDITSGTVTADAEIDDIYNRGEGSNPFNSKLVGLYGPTGTAASDTTTTLLQTATTPAFQSGLPYVVASVEVLTYGPEPSAFTTATVTLEIYDTDSSTIVASVTHDLKAESLPTARQLFCHASNNPAGSSQYQWRLKLRGVRGAGSSARCFIYFGEPLLHLSYTTDPIPFQPTIAFWVPFTARAYNVAGSIPAMELSSTKLAFGTGAATADIALERIAGSVLRLHENGASADASLQIGDDVRLMDVDVTDALGIQGVTNAANGKIVFGSGKDTNLYRAAADALATDDALLVGGSDAGQTGSGTRIHGDGAMEMRGDNPYIDFKTITEDYGFRIIYDFNVSDGVEFAGAAGGYHFKDGDTSVVGDLNVTGDIRDAGGTELRAPYRMQAGTVVTSGSSASSGSVAVTFDTGRFTQTPIVVVSQYTLPGGSGKIIPKVYSPSTSGFTLYWYTGDGTNVSFTDAGFMWVAVQMTSSAGAG